MRWGASCWKSLPLSDAGKNFLPDHTIYSLTLLTRHWRSTGRGEPRSLIRTNCDLAYHCTVPKNVRRTACRGSTSSASSISNLETEPESTESSVQACSPYAANLFCSDRSWLSSSGNLGNRRNRLVLDRLAWRL